MKEIVISGINIIEGGALSIYKECLHNLVENGYAKANHITAFVNRKDLFKEFEDDITLIELPKSKKSWLMRIYYEYIYFFFYSKKRKIDIWFSIHDITPNVKAKKRFVYCHNPSPFLKTSLKQLKYEYRVFLFSVFYKYLYKINIKKNTNVIVQQDWLREEFEQMYHIHNVIVARPNVMTKNISNTKRAEKCFTFLFPAYPRNFKNFEVICEATKKLTENSLTNFKVLLTIDGKENKYSTDIVSKYHGIPQIQFIGLQKQQDLFALYGKVNCLIFPSKLETWGLPITEFKVLQKPIILANLKYAHETLGQYDKASFFEPDDSEELAQIMEREIKGENIYILHKERPIKQPYTKNWKELFEIIFK